MASPDLPERVCRGWSEAWGWVCPALEPGSPSPYQAGIRPRQEAQPQRGFALVLTHPGCWKVQRFLFPFYHWRC